MNKLQHLDEVVAPKLAVKHGIDLMDGPRVEYIDAEYLLHELAHRETLGLNFLRNVSDRMGVRISNLPGHRQDFNEAQSCAVELLAWQMLGGDYGDLESPLLSYAASNCRVYTEKRFVAVVRRCVQTRKAARIAHRIVRMVEAESLTPART